MNETGFLETILQRRLLIVLGKGGVGKTTVSSAIAYRIAEQGYSTLLMGIDSTAQLETFFNLSPLEGAGIHEVNENLSVVNLNRHSIFDESVRKIVKLRSLADRIIKAPMYQYFAAVAPGIKELYLLGRIYDLATQKSKITRRYRYDYLIVDAPATGHSVSLFDLPRTVSKLMPVGPLPKRAAKLLKYFQDAEKTAFLIVTLAEEMPTNETIELYDKLVNSLEMSAICLVVNLLYPKPFREQRLEERFEKMQSVNALKKELPNNISGFPDEFWDTLLKYTTFRQSRRAINNKYLEVIKEGIPLPKVHLELLPAQKDNVEMLSRIADSLMPEQNTQPGVGADES